MQSNSRMFGRTSTLRLRPAILIVSPEELSVIPLDGLNSADCRQS